MTWHHKQDGVHLVVECRVAVEPVISKHCVGIQFSCERILGSNHDDYNDVTKERNKAFIEFKLFDNLPRPCAVTEANSTPKVCLIRNKALKDHC